MNMRPAVHLPHSTMGFPSFLVTPHTHRTRESGKTEEFCVAPDLGTRLELAAGVPLQTMDGIRHAVVEITEFVLLSRRAAI